MSQSEIDQLESEIKSLNKELYDWTRAYGHFKVLNSSNEVVWIFEKYFDADKTLPGKEEPSCVGCRQHKQDE